MQLFGLLENKIQNYDWGSHTGIAELLGESTPTSEPQAELWMGAHPKASSSVVIDDTLTSLRSLIEQEPAAILGRPVADAFSNRLPFLFKVLAADRPLSIQAHPNIIQANDGYLREENENIPLTAPNRNYKDDNHKPEIICALTNFWALNGFRPAADVLSITDQMQIEELCDLVQPLAENPNADGLRRCFESLMKLDVNSCHRLVLQIAAYARMHESDDRLFRWLVAINEVFPGDVGVLCAMFLNLVCLKPGEAMFLPAQQLHAYLDGVGIELMANSDNVLRGGLTTKHIDVDELSGILKYDPTTISLVVPESGDQNELYYKAPVNEFLLTKIAIEEGRPYYSGLDRSIEIYICTSGNAIVQEKSSQRQFEVIKGMSFVISANIEQYSMEGEAEFFRASVPLGHV